MRLASWSAAAERRTFLPSQPQTLEIQHGI